MPTRVRDSAMFVLLFVGSYKYGLRVPSSRIKFVPCFVKIGQHVQKLTCRDTHKHAAFVLSSAGMKYDNEITYTYILREWRWAPFMLFTDYTARKFHLCMAVLCDRSSLFVWPFRLCRMPCISLANSEILVQMHVGFRIASVICPSLIIFVSVGQIY